MPAACQTRPDPLSFDAAIRAIRALGDLFDNRSTPDEGPALDAFQAGRAAYWTRAGYSNAKACLLLTDANRFSLENALEVHADDDHPSQAARAPYLLGTLIPLNRAACAELERAWSRIGAGENAIRRARAAMPAPMFDDLQAAE